MKEFEARWIGWAGVNVPDEVGQKALTKALAEKVKHFCARNLLNLNFSRLAHSRILYLTFLIISFSSIIAEVYSSIP